MPSNLDLRKWQDNSVTYDAFSSLVSGGRLGYKTVIIKDKPKLKCQNCGFELSGEEKFCPECGTKVEKETGESKAENKSENNVEK